MSETNSLSSLGDFSETLVPVSNRSKIARINIRTGARVTFVHPFSPAHDAGIQAGWTLVLWRGNVPASGLGLTGPCNPLNNTFFADLNGNYFEWKADFWPFGIKISPAIEGKLLGKISKLELNQEIMLDYWRNNDLGAFTAMHAALKNGIKQEFKSTFWEKITGRSKKVDLTEVKTDFVLGFLALAEYQSGNIEEAQKVLDAAEVIREKKHHLSNATYDVGLWFYVQALIYVDTGKMEQAKQAAQNAYDLVPKVLPVRDLMSTFHGGTQFEEIDPLVGKKIPFDYKLPDADPIKPEKTDYNNFMLSDALSKTNDDQIFALLVLGPYRANYYGNIDLLRLASVHRAFPDLISGVHIVVSGTRVADDESRVWFENTCKTLGLEFTILYDEDDKIMPQLPGLGSPQRVLLSNQGIVLSRKEFADESGIWEAYENLVKA
ncbi:hypothetical protein F9L33_13990 [Amylibacter sp. SFDW26]|uniref:tetratricopeptide repeat protein n=1 Tax=Amylibacter sp. SFDW26 TaxID=2652722 RepID=UPI001261A7F2|nr:hypothetical protein [Amylibacter sp. SFDW26]KAB7610408.1 hypothetical protein F9L33_13990 [Amylibacter sp. SFDW26]